MHLHERELFVGQPPVLVEHLIRHRDLAEVVNTSREADQLHLTLGEMHLPGDSHRMRGDALRMLECVGVATVDHVGHGLHRCQRLLAHLNCPLQRELETGQRRHHHQRQPRVIA